MNHRIFSSGTLAWLGAATCLVAALSGPASIAHAGAAQLPTTFVDTQVAGSLAAPVGLALIPNEASSPVPRVLFVEQRTARVGLVIGGTVYTVGTVPSVSSVDNERGLLGIAVDPRFPAAPYLYIHCTDSRSGHTIAISRFTLTGDLDYASTGQIQFAGASRYDLLRNLVDNANNHNGGTVRFGIDGQLYVSLGDDANGCAAQDTAALAGKILRLDVSRLPDGPGGPPPLALLAPLGNPFATSADSTAQLVWALGLRNPFRFNIDASTGAVIVADVGQDRWEEISLITAGGANLGWPLLEGPQSYSSCAGTVTLGMQSPIAYYDHSTGVAIMSAGIYRGPSSGGYRFPLDYEGDAFFLDYYTGIMRRLRYTGSSWVIAPPAPGQPTVDNWGEGLKSVGDVLHMPDGTLWYCRTAVNGAPMSGEIRRIAYVSATAVTPSMGNAIAFAAPVPTPSRNAVKLAWSQPTDALVQLIIFDAAGRTVQVLHHGEHLPAGAYERVWDGKDGSGRFAAPGLYFAQLQVGGEMRRARITLVR